MALTPQILEDRLVAFGTEACFAIGRMPNDLVGTHVSKQLIRSATSPAANYAEARSAESRRDFVHKLQICLKELRETSVWLGFAHRLWKGNPDTMHLAQECDELISIFVKTVNTTRNSNRKR